MARNDGRAPGPDVAAVTDDHGAYTFSVLTWTLEDLAGSASFQMMVQVTPPPGFLVVGVTKSVGGPAGGGIGMLMGPLFLSDLVGPIDITLGPGHIVEGTVTSGRTGAPLAGIQVLALRPNSLLIYGGVGDAFEVEAAASTDATGRYRLTVPSGTYVIDANGRIGTDGAQRFWSDDPVVFQATPLKIDRALAGIDIALVPVTAIQGEIRDGPRAFAEGAAGIRVVAYAAGGTPCCRIVGVATTSCCGTFLMYVPQGVYRIGIEPPAGSPYAAQWWSGAAGFATATDVLVGSAPVQLVVELVRVRP